MNIVIAGASGLIGSALVPALRAAGYTVRALVRRTARNQDEIAWDPAAGVLAAAALEGTDAFINLSGENVGAGRWTAARRERILRSRVDATRTLVHAMQRMHRKPVVLLNASALGIYGDRGDAVVDESGAMGVGFLPEVCLAWETHASRAVRLGVRVALLRFGLVLARDGGVLAKMLPLFRLGLGGRIGDGRQWMSWIALDDVVGVVLHVLRDSQLHGPVNVVAPGAVTNVAFTAELGRSLHRPAIFPAPAWVLRLAFGRMADEALLASTRAVPRRLAESGYRFTHSEFGDALRVVLG